MQLKTVATIFAVLAGIASASNQAAAPSGNYGGGIDNNSGFTGGYGTDSDLADDEINVILEAHNAYRAGCGLPPLNYDKKVGSVAQQWARRNPGGCSAMNHNNNRQGLGENIACQTGGSDRKKLIRDMINRWGGEYKSCGNTAGCAFRGGSSKNGATGHFTQIVDRTCKSVGCGFKKGFLVCNYYPAGNMRGREKQNICPNGFRGLGNGAGGKITNGGAGGSPTPAPPSYGGNTSPAPSYGGNNSPAPVTPRPPVYRPQPSNNNSGNNNGGNRGRVRYYTKVVSKPSNFNNGGFIPVRGGDSGNSGNSRPSKPFYGNNNNDSGSGGRSYGNNNNNGGSQPDKDCDETKKAKKL